METKGSGDIDDIGVHIIAFMCRFEIVDESCTYINM